MNKIINLTLSNNIFDRQEEWDLKLKINLKK